MNKTEGTTKNYHKQPEGEVQSRVECIRSREYNAQGGSTSMKGEDTFKVSIQKLLHSYEGVIKKLEKCGIHETHKNHQFHVFFLKPNGIFH